MFRLLLLFGIGIEFFFADEPGQSFRGKALLKTQIALNDQFSLGMRLQPALASFQEFLDFILSDPVMLFGVEHRDEDIKVREQVLQ